MKKDDLAELIFILFLVSVPSGKPRVISVSGKSSTELEMVWESPPSSLWNSREIGYTIGYR